MRKTSKKSLTRKLDQLVSKIVRKRGWCQRCGRVFTLQCCHIFSRTYKSVRWDLDNVLTLCASCHFFFHKNPLLFTEFVHKLYGKKKYEELKKKARTTSNWTIEEMKELYGRLCNKRVRPV